MTLSFKQDVGHCSMVCELLLVNWLYHIFQCIMVEKKISSNCNSQMFLKSVVLINTTLSGKLKKLAQTPKVSYWPIGHFWENSRHSNIDIPIVSYWLIRHFWETCHIVLSDTFGKYICIYQKGIFSYICTSYYNVNAMTLKLLHWKIRTSSLELKNNPKLGLRPRGQSCRAEWTKLTQGPELSVSEWTMLTQGPELSVFAISGFLVPYFWWNV